MRIIAMSDSHGNAYALKKIFERTKDTGDIFVHLGDGQRELMQGKFDSAIKNMKPDEARIFNAVLSNPQMLEKLMSAPQAQALYQKLTGGQGGQNNNGRR